MWRAFRHFWNNKFVLLFFYFFFPWHTVVKKKKTNLVNYSPVNWFNDNSSSAANVLAAAAVYGRQGVYLNALKTVKQCVFFFFFFEMFSKFHLTYYPLMEKHRKKKNEITIFPLMYWFRESDYMLVETHCPKWATKA